MLWKSPHIAIIPAIHHVKLQPHNYGHLITPQPLHSHDHYDDHPSTSHKRHDAWKNRKDMLETKETRDVSHKPHTNKTKNDQDEVRSM